MGSARAWPALGIVAWAVALTGFAVHGYPRANASPQQLVAWTSSTDAARFTIGIDVEAIGYLIFLFFVGWLCAVVRRSGGAAWLLAVALVSTGTWVAANILSNGVWTALLDAGKHGAGSQSLVAIRDVALEIFNASNFLLAPALVAFGLATVRGTALPRLLAWTATVIGIFMLVPPLAYLLQLLFLIWVVAVSVYFLMRPATAAVEPAVTPV